MVEISDAGVSYVVILPGKMWKELRFFITKKGIVTDTWDFSEDNAGFNPPYMVFLFWFAILHILSIFW